MSYDGRIPPGGGVRSGSGGKLPEQPEDPGVKGKFKTTSGGSRDVSLKEGKSHIPAATDNGPQGRPIDDWEVKIQESEQLFFSKAADILTSDEKGVEKDRIRDELKTLHTCMAELLTEYSRRISELAADDRIMEKNIQQIKGPMVRVFQTVKDELVQLEKSLASNASKAAKKEVKDVLPIAKSQIEEANKVLSEAKALLLESTLSPLPEVKVHPVPKPVSREREAQEKQAQKKKLPFRKQTRPETSPPVETVPLEQRLQNLRQRLLKDGSEHAQGILQNIVSVLEKLGLQLEEHVQDMPDDQLKNKRKKQFDTTLNIIRKASEGKVTPKVRSEMKEQIWVCEQCIKDITGWQGKVSVKQPKTVTQPPLELKKATSAYLAASEIRFAPLQKQVETLNTSTSPGAQKEALRQMDHYIRNQRDRFNRLLPLLQAVTTKCDFEQRDPPAECAHIYGAMGRLNKALVAVHKRVLSEDYFAAVKEADAVLMDLDSFDQKLPPRLWHDLTETVVQPNKATPHFLNLMCRRILNEETGPLSERASLQKFTDICSYLEKAQGGKLDENTDAETIQALRKVAGDVFSSPAKVRALMAQARTLEEVRAVGFQLVNWNDMQHEYLNQVCKKLEVVAKDLELENIREGRDELDTLIRHFTSGTEAVAGRESARRLSRLETEIKQAVEQIVKERVENPGFLNQFRKNEKVCEKLQKELNEELGGVASIELTPGTSREQVLRRVEVKLSDAKEKVKVVNATLSSKGKYATRLRERLLTSGAKDLLVEDTAKQTCQWEPHPKRMIQKFADDFVASFEKYERAVNLAREHEDHVNRLIAARERANSELARVEDAIPTVAQLKRKMRRRSKQRKQAHNLGQLTTKVRGLKGKPLKHLTVEATPIRDLVVNMLRHRQLDTDEAIELLEPLYTVQQTAMRTTPALQTRSQPLSASQARRTKNLETTLNELQKKYRWKNLWHRLTRRKRVEAVETARSLVTICEACPHAPIANAQMLDQFIDELKKLQGSHPDYKRLKNSLVEYADHLQKSSTPITYAQAAGAA